MGISISCDGCYCRLADTAKPTFEVIFKGLETVGFAYLCAKCLSAKRSLYTEVTNPEYVEPPAQLPAE